MGEVNQDTILQHQRKRRRHKIKLAVGSFVVILVAIILIATYAILSKNYYNEYKENAEVEYKIRLNENEFYTGEYLEGSTGVVASIIKDIEAEFKYKLDLKEEQDYIYDYKILSQIEVKEGSREDSIYTIEEEIEEIMDSDKLTDFTAVNDKIGVSEIRTDLLDEYVYFFRKNFEEDFENYEKENFVVAIDTANGATSVVAEKVFAALGIKHYILNNTPNGININDNCGSTHLDVLKKYVVENKCNLGIAYDGDGDRCLAVDENGEEIDGDRLIAIISKYLKEKGKLKNDTIVATIMSNMGLNKFAANNNLTLKQTKVGDRYVLEEMLKNDYNLGGEQSGHIIMLDYNPTGDGILTSLMLIQILLEKKVKVSELSKIMKKYPQAQVNVKVCNEKKPLYQEDSEILNEINVIKEKLGDNGRIVVRASGTEPLIRVMLEGENQSELEEMANKLAKLIKVKLN